MKPLTERQKEVLIYISQHIDDYGFPPTMWDICNNFGFKSPTAAQCHMSALEKKGCLIITKRVARGTSITPLGKKMLKATL